MASRKFARRISTSSPFAVRSRAMIEGLEDRRLLSASVAGLAHTNFLLSRPIGTQGSTNQPAASTSPYGLSPNQVRKAYGLDQTSFNGIVGDGSGQTIAIVDAYDAPNIRQDLQTFSTTFGLPDLSSFSFTVVGQDGSSTLPGTDPAGRGNSWAVETSLDVEWVHAMAPKANIVLVEANSNYTSDLFKAIDTARKYPGVSAVSLSWGGGEYSTQSQLDSYFVTPAGHNGVTFIASSGDSGAYDYYNTSTLAVEYPAASPRVLSVGGTRLTLDSAGNYLSESGWGNGTNSGTSGGAGGGISKYYSQPVYQNGIVTQTSTKRALPDVAFLADPATGVSVIDSWDNPTAPWMKVGGTSLAAPMWAGVVGIANQGRALAGLGSLDGFNETLPKLYALPSTDFHDITTGNNGYAAGPGFDLVTGRGTPIVNLLVKDLVGNTPAPTPAPTIGSLTVNPLSTPSGATITLSANNVTETGGTVSAVNFYRESNGVAGLQIGSDTLVGAGTGNGSTWTTSDSTSGFAPGSYTYYAVATDAANVSSAAAQAKLTIVAPTIGSLTISPNSVSPGAAITLSANNVTETGGTIAGVSFYQESNGIAGLQVGSDTLVGPGAQNGTTWTAGTAAPAAGGQFTYYAVATDAPGYSSNVAAAQLTVVVPTPGAPVNDMFANATVVSGTTLALTGTNVRATVESGEPRHAGLKGGKSVWWTWTASSSGRVTLDTRGSSFDTLLAVYTGNAVSALTRVASNDDNPAGGTLTSALSFNAVAGATYRIAVDGYRGASGNIALNLAQTVTAATTTTNGAGNTSGGGLPWQIWTGSGLVDLGDWGSSLDAILAGLWGNLG